MRMLLAVAAAFLLYASIIAVSLTVNHYAELGYTHVHNYVQGVK